jgi:hypothetical protein
MYTLYFKHEGNWYHYATFDGSEIPKYVEFIKVDKKTKFRLVKTELLVEGTAERVAKTLSEL